MALNKIPYITLILAALNIIVYVVGQSAQAPYQANVQTKERDLVGYVTQHPELDLPAETFENISPGGQTAIGFARSERLKVGETMAVVDDKLALMEHFLESDDPDAPPAPEDDESMQAIIEAERERQQAELDVYVREFEASLAKNVYKDFGFVPAHGSLTTMITSLFLHDSGLQLAVNLLLLLVLGYVLEGAWRALVFPVFYLFSGFAATLAYSLSAPGSQVPLLGMAGILAALAGAVAVRSYDAEDAALSLAKGIGGLILTLGVLFGLRAASEIPGFGDMLGGAAVGALVAGVFRLTRFEQRALLPEADRKAEDAARHLERGMNLLDEGKIGEAIDALKHAEEAEPENSLIAKELCKAYAQKGSRKTAARKFKQVLSRHLRQDALEEAVDDYVELSDALPEAVLPTDQHLRLAAALNERAEQSRGEDQRRLFRKAAGAYRALIAQSQQTQTLDSPDGIAALTHYAGLCANRLNLPNDARQAYMLLMKLSQVSEAQKQAARARLRDIDRNAGRDAGAPTQQTASGNAGKDAGAPTRRDAGAPDIPLKQRIKLLKPLAGAPSSSTLKSVAPISTKSITAVPGGMHLGRGSEAELRFDAIYAIIVAQLPGPLLVADVFLGGQPRPYRLRSDAIAYPQFLPKLHQHSVKNFHQFLLRMIQHIAAVYLDQASIDFLHSGTIPQYAGQDALETHERALWQQLVGKLRVPCEQCWRIYWVDRQTIPAGGASTTCAQCGHAIHVSGAISHPATP